MLILVTFIAALAVALITIAYHTTQWRGLEDDQEAVTRQFIPPWGKPQVCTHLTTSHDHLLTELQSNLSNFKSYIGNKHNHSLHYEVN